MQARMHRSLHAALSLLGALVLAATSAHLALATDGCPTGTRIATLNDTVVTNGVIKEGTCYNPNDANLGANVEQAKQQLDSMWCGGKRASCGQFTSSVQELDPKFATCAAKFLAAVRQRDPSICIESAYRSSPHQACVCSQTSGPCAAPGNSLHQKGLALDLGKPGSNTLPSFVHQMAQQGGGVSFPIRNDDGHMQPSSSSGDCSTPGYVAPDTPYSGPAQTPTSGFSNAVRSYMAPQQAAAPAPTNALPASSQPYTYAQPNQTGATTNPGVSTSVGTSSPTGSIPTTIGAANVSDQLNSNSPTGTGTSTYDLLSVLAGNTPQATTTATGTPLALNGSLYQVQQLTQTGQYDTNGNPIALNPGTAHDVSALGPGGQQTFTSQDLQYSPADTYAPPSNTTVMQRTLETLKQALEKLLGILRPFGYVWGSSTEHGD